MGTLEHHLSPRPRMTLVLADGQIAEIWVDGRAPLISIHDYDWAATDPGHCRDKDGFPFSRIT